MILNEGQQRALEIAVKRYQRGVPYTVLAGPAGSGKAQPVDTIIPTPKGMRPLGELQVGDYVFDRFGKPTKILGVYPQGEKEVFEITFQDGRKTKCCDEHLWPYWTSKNNLSMKTTRQMLEAGLQYASREYKFPVPTLTSPVEFEITQTHLLQDPYLVGVFLGDGCCTERALTLSSQDEEIVAEISTLLGAKEYRKNHQSNYNWTFVLPEEQWTYHQKAQTLRSFLFSTSKVFKGIEDALITKAENKYIPQQYKYASIQDRYSLLQGLLDTDGSISVAKGRYNICFTNTSLRLIKDMQEVLYSLGYASNISEDNRIEKYTTGVCYTLSINIPNEEKYKLFRLKRKKDLAIQAQGVRKKHKYDRSSIINIQSLHYKTEMVCIYVDNHEHLYLTNDYIVSHNTTVLRFIISALGLDPVMDVVYATPTGKAAQVLKKRGNPNAMTLHKLLYRARQDKNGKYSFVPREELEIEPQLICVDEVSMVDSRIWRQLLSWGIPVLAMGDNHQLPPIFPDRDPGVLAQPHIALTEIMRQEKGNEIIDLATHVREGHPLSTYHCRNEQVQIITKNDICTGHYEWADQILCATNETRRLGNITKREILGFDPNRPCAGDSIISLKNHWDFFSDDFEPLINGSIGRILDYEVEKIYFPRHISTERYNLMLADIETEDGEIYREVPIDYDCLMTGIKTLSDKQEMQLKRSERYDGPIPFEMNFSYFCTCHKY